MNSIKVEAIERIIFAMTSDVFPMEMVSEIERFLGVKGCVLQLQWFLDRTCALTLCSSEAVDKLSTTNHLILARKKYPFRYCDKRPSRIRVLNVHSKLTLNNIDSRMQMYGKIFYSEIERRSNNLNSYFAVIDLKRAVPEKVTIRRKDYEVVSY